MDVDVESERWEERQNLVFGDFAGKKSVIEWLVEAKSLPRENIEG